MKIAICLKGHMRNMGVIHSINQLKLHHEVDVYIHTYDEVGTKSSQTGVDSPKKGTILPNSGTIDEELIKVIFSPKKMVVEKYENVEPELDEITEQCFYNWIARDAVYPNTIISQIRQRALCIDLIEEEYDYIIITRPDVSFEFRAGVSVKDNFIGITETTVPMYNHPAGGIWFDDLVLAGTQSTVKRIADFYHNIRNILADLQQKNYVDIARCMHQIQSYAFQHHCGINLIGIDGLYSRIG